MAIESNLVKNGKGQDGSCRNIKLVMCEWHSQQVSDYVGARLELVTVSHMGSYITCNKL